MDQHQSPSSRITSEVTSWPGVTAGMGARGELSFKVAAKEIGHLHGESVAHFFFDKTRWAELRAAGRIVHHACLSRKNRPCRARNIR